MNAFKIAGPEETPWCSRADLLRVAVIYDSLRSQVEALELYSKLVDGLGSEIEFESSWWSFEQLRNTRTSKEAARAAARADFVILGLAAHNLSAEFKSWMILWPSWRRDQETALIGLIGTEPGKEKDTATAQVWLKQGASGAGFSFFCSTFRLEAPASARPTSASGRTGDFARASKRIPQPDSHFGWGINE
jgi:hypothetical protein